MEDKKMLNVEKKENGQELEFVISGRLDTMTAPELEAHLKDRLEGISSLILDITGLSYISSAGLRTVSYLHMNMKKGGQSRAIHCNDVVKDVFEITKFNAIIAVE